MTTATLQVSINKTENSRINQLDPNNLQFGKLYSDHMLLADYENGAWNSVKIVPYANISFSPATTFFHYGQAIFEGVKAYRTADGRIAIFRPHDNWKRLNVSAHRMGMPDVPEEIFIEGLKQLIQLDEAWVPDGEGASLYIRPFMVATDEFIGVKPAEKFKFMIITSPAGPYYAKPVSIYVQDEFARAFPGGIGFTKAAGNYGASMYPTAVVRSKGFDQILWTDAVEHKYVQEIGTMNVFFVIGNKVITPSLDQGTILAGITRDSVITLFREKGFEVEERMITVEELVEAFKNGLLKEAFGTGTAASLSLINKLTIHDELMELPSVDTWQLAPWVKKELNDIRYGRVPDRHNWLFYI